MGSIDEIQQVCRLCLDKDEVNIPIFDESSDARQTFLKISACLPVKVSRDDNLPKNICDGCSCKLDMLYVFRNTSVDSEKQLIQWLNQAGLSVPPSTAVRDGAAKPEILVKQEAFDSSEMSEAQNYLIQQQKLTYSEEFAFGEVTEDSPGDLLPENEEPSPKRARRSTAKRQPVLDDTDDDEMDSMHITKAEADEDDSDDGDQADYGDTASADDQPGPSGVNRSGADAPGDVTGEMYTEEEEDDEEETILSYTCNICTNEFQTEDDFLKHHLRDGGKLFGCCKCDETYKSIGNLYAHLENHRKNSSIMIDESGEGGVLSYDAQTGAISSNEQLLYILEDPDNVNEVVVAEDPNASVASASGKPEEHLKIVQMEHGYVKNLVKYNVLGGSDKVRGIITVGGKPAQSMLPFKLQPTTSKIVYTPPKPRPRQIRRRHVVPDFSSTDYQFFTSSEEVEMPHYKCMRCEQIFINKFGFFRHVEKGKCYINFCDVCNATFTKNSDFLSHYMVEHQDRAICNFCFRTFMYEKNVKEHMLRHLDQFRHRCEECNKGFYTIREYRNHYKNRHMGVKYTCTICSRSFGDEYYFRKHLGTHEAATETTEVIA